MLGEGVVEGLAHGLEEVGAELDGAVVLLDGAFDAVDVGALGVAEPVLGAAAEEVQVLLAAAGDGAAHDHAADGPVASPAGAAPQGALEVVVHHAAAFACPAPRGEEVLHLVEQLPVDERLVPAGVFLAFVRDDADVVRVLEHLVDLGDGDRAGGAALGGAGAQSSVGEFVLDVFEGRLACGVHLECEPDEWRTLVVDGDSADLAAVDAVDGVDVPDGCFAERAALLGLLAHLVGDVGSLFGGAELAERGEDAVHELPDRGLVDGLGGGDEGDSALLEFGTDDGIVEAVPGHA